METAHEDVPNAVSKSISCSDFAGAQRLAPGISMNSLPGLT
jgi:hypothetical protein